MGWFSPKKTIQVSSVVYNMAGDVDKRPNFLKTTVLGGVLNEQGLTISETLQKSYIGGSGIKLRSFGRWARTRGLSAAMGQNASSLSLGNSLNNAVLAAQIPHAAGQEVVIQTSEIGVPDYSYWADQYMADAHPDLVNGSWMANFDESANIIDVVYPSGGGTATHSFTPAGFALGSKYIYARYTLAEPSSIEPIVYGSLVTLATGAPFPSTTGMSLVASSSVPTPINLYTYVNQVVTYSDGRPAEVTNTNSFVTSSYSETMNQYEKTVFMGRVPGPTDETYSIRTITTQWQTAVAQLTAGTPVVTTETIAGGVTKTTTTTTSVETIKLVRSYRTDTQRIVNRAWSNMKVFIYKRDSGNPALDAMFNPSGVGGTFLPYMPIRLSNNFIEVSPELRDIVDKGLRRGLNTSYQKIRDQVADNPNLGNIDFAYVVFGVSLNVKENACRRYIYEFFQEIMLGRDLSGSDYASWESAWAAAASSWSAWKAWRAAQELTSDPLYGTPEPERIPYPEPPLYEVVVNSAGAPDINYDMNISWRGIRESVDSGSLAAKGQVWIENLGVTPFDYDLHTDGTVTTVAQEMEKIRIRYQEDADTIRTLEVWGLYHRNMIYGGKSVDISAGQALSDGNESGFIIPLHENIYRRMNLVEATQMSTACVFMVFNCFEIVKERWYQSSWFKVLLVIAVVVITVVSGGFGASSAGILGVNSAIGASLGFTGTAAAIVGAVANAVAAMIVTQIITRASTMLFGDKIGAIIGAIASIVALQVGTSYMAGNGIFSGFESLLRADNLLKMTSSVGNAYAEGVKADTQDVLNKTAEAQRDYISLSKELSARSDELFGNESQGVFNPMALVGTNQPTNLESPATFLGRTLLTGSDIAALSTELVSNFATVTLNNQLPGT